MSMYQYMRFLLVGVLLAAVVSGCAGRGRAFRSSQLDDERGQAKSVVVVPAAYAPKEIFRLVPRTDVSQELFEKHTADTVAPLRKALQGQGIRLDDPRLSPGLAVQVAAQAAGLTSSTVSVVNEAGPKTIDADIDRAALAGHKADLAIVVRVNEVGFIGAAALIENDPVVRFGIEGNVSVVSVRDGAELLKERLVSISKPGTISDWSKNIGAVQRHVDVAIKELGKRSVEYAFLLYDLKPDNAADEYEHCVLRLREPTMPPKPPFIARGLGQSLNSHIRELLRAHMGQFGTAESLQPVLKWEAFPRDRDRTAGPKGFADRVTDVTYDVKLWKGRNGVPEDLVYERTGIKARETWTERMSAAEKITESGVERSKPSLIKEGVAEHKVELPLERAAEYYWTVRARFKLDGKTKVTMWSRFLWGAELIGINAMLPCDDDNIGLSQAYRFKTPYEAAAQ